MSDLFAVIIALPEARDPVVVGVALGERARRAAVLGGVAAERVVVVRSDAERARARETVRGPAIVVDARAQVVMPELVEALAAARGPRRAVDDEGRDAGAMRVDAWDDAGAELPELRVGPLARHPHGDGADASAWLWRFAYKPELDSTIVRYVYRPLSHPFTRLFVRLPFSPNAITIVAIAIAQLGCLLAARPGYRELVLGSFLVAFPSGILDAVDGEVARLRLQRSKLGAWLDAIGDDVLRVAMILAIGAHVAPAYPGLPVWWIAVGSAALTVLAMAPMYWYCITVLRSPNIQTYRALMAGPGTGRAETLAKLGAEVAGRDFIDLAVFALAVVDLPIVATFGLAIGSVVAFALVIPMHLKAVRLPRQT